jgi:3-oxoacyl-(acyl-carrier-protein) synthase
MIRSGEVEAAVAGGADAPITPLTLASFIGSGLVSASNGEPETASRPFDLTRESGVLAEGAGIFVLENWERALARGALSYVEIEGYGKQRDTDREKPASGLFDSMRLALANAGRSMDDVDYISAYGPGDPTLDAAEVAAIKQLFGARAYEIPVTSIKGVTGNPLGASGPLQVAACALAIRDRRIPPTANLRSFDPSCDLDFVPEQARRGKIDCALINVRGIGGSASTLVLRRPDNG